MPVQIDKEVTTKSSGPLEDQVNQTATTTEAPTNDEQKDARSDRGSAWIWYIVGIIDLLLGLRLIFHLLGAKAVGFADLLYSVSGFFAAPFRGIFQNPKVDGAYFDTAALVAIIIYIIVGWIIARLIDLVTRPANSKNI
jgi:hypothetical protein